VPLDLAATADPKTTAFLISECQRDVVGDMSRLPALAESAAPAVANVARLAAGARAAGVQVVHALAGTRPDGKGANVNTRINAGLRRLAAAAPPDPGQDGAETVPEIGTLPEDIVLRRMAGMSPFYDNGVDSVLRNLGVKTIVLAGVSLNIAVPNAVMDAVNRGYVVIVPEDAVAGVPAEYGEAVLRNTITYLAYLTTTDAVLDFWASLTP
jgi:nicotinamidase-related amidase